MLAVPGLATQKELDHAAWTLRSAAVGLREAAEQLGDDAAATNRADAADAVWAMYSPLVSVRGDMRSDEVRLQLAKTLFSREFSQRTLEKTLAHYGTELPGAVTSTLPCRMDELFANAVLPHRQGDWQASLYAEMMSGYAERATYQSPDCVLALDLSAGSPADMRWGERFRTLVSSTSEASSLKSKLVEFAEEIVPEILADVSTAICAELERVVDRAMSETLNAVAVVDIDGTFDHIRAVETLCSLFPHAVAGGCVAVSIPRLLFEAAQDRWSALRYWQTMQCQGEVTPAMLKRLLELYAECEDELFESFEEYVEVAYAMASETD